MKQTKTDAEIDRLAKGGHLLANILAQVASMVKPGVSGIELDQRAREFIKAAGAEPAFLDYQGFPAALCVSPDSQVVHGLPTAVKLKAGQIVGLDLGIYYDGLYTDTAVTVPVAEIDESRRRLLSVTEESLARGIAAATLGNTLNDIGRAIQEFVEPAGFTLVRDFVGHGVGYAVHEDPNVPNFVTPDGDIPLELGMVLAIEPMVNVGVADLSFGQDDWTVTTADGQPSAHFEHTIAVTKNGPRILTA